MKKAKVTFFVSGNLREREFEFFSWTTIINDMNAVQTDNYGWINEYEILRLELIPSES